MSEQAENSKEEDLPPIGECVLVRCKGFTCMAFRDTKGDWRDYFHRELLEGPVRVLGVPPKP